MDESVASNGSVEVIVSVNPFEGASLKLWCLGAEITSFIVSVGCIDVYICICLRLSLSSARTESLYLSPTIQRWNCFDVEGREGNR